MRSIVFFNNKGGVGKTTLACNMASQLSVDLELRTLVVDCDPQCNATQLLLGEDEWLSIYDNRPRSEAKTILKVLSNIRAGDSTIDADILVHSSPRFSVDLLAGHPTLSAIEDRLSQSWSDFAGGDLGGARRSRWVAALLNALKSSYDLVIFDVGPSLGALNRSVLLGADQFITPMSADLFSLYALDNISEWLNTWDRDYARGIALVEEKNAGALERFNLPPTAQMEKAYIGYTVQQYVSRRTGNKVRSVAAYDRFRQQIPDRARALSGRSSAPDESPALGVVPNMFSMIPLAQGAHSPIRGLTPADGVRGAQVTQQANYKEQLESIGERLAINAGLVGLGEPSTVSP